MRWVNDWDNLDGTIERGYAGRSIFFDNDNIRADLTRVREYARLLASIGINGCAINNVNANPRVLTPEFLPQLVQVADIFRAWGVRLAIAVDLSSPKLIGGLDTFDPLDPTVAKWWRDRVDRDLRSHSRSRRRSSSRPIPKAGSARRPMTVRPPMRQTSIARALKPHGGIVFYRAFVYNHHLDWRDPKNDRAKAAYDNFHPLDGKFDDNVIMQIKHGPIDFQAREPVSPLFSGLEKTNEAIELQITQEYTGQQRHLCFLAPMWKQVLDFDMHAGRDHTRRSKRFVAGKVFHRPIGGFVGVANVGLDANWLAHPLAMANLYAFGRLAWNPDLTRGAIAEEWTQLTFGDDPDSRADDRRTCCSRRGRRMKTTLGRSARRRSPTLPAATSGRTSSRRKKTAGDSGIAPTVKGVGMDRTVATGTGYVGQYRPPVASVVRIARDYARRAPAVLSSRAVHDTSCILERR